MKNHATILAVEPITAEKLYQVLQKVKLGGQTCHYSLKKCEEFAPLINEINELKREQHAVILAHTYVTPEIIYGVADFVGDSYALSKDAMATDAQKIVFAAVRFMGETAKILNPGKDVLVPATDAGCTLADAITADQVKDLRRQFPDYTFVCYVNTSVEVKAECDVCVTSANIYPVIINIPNDKIYFLPDKYMGQNMIEEFKKRGVKKDIKYYHGTCYAHEEFGLEEVLRVKEEFPEAKVVSHPECKPEVCRISDFVGSTSQMFDYMRSVDADTFLMLTECGLGARLEIEFPNKRLVGACRLCKYMKSNSLQEILRVLKTPTDRDRVIINEEVRRRALKCLQNMFLYAEK